MTIKTSIITICYNSKSHIENTIRSVITQDYDEIEYIIVDGRSTDGTLDIIKDYATKDHRIRWISEPDKGISDAFNKGIRLSKGDLIGIINSDDMYAPGALRAVASASVAHPEYDVFHGDIAKLEAGRPVFRLKPSGIGNNIWHEMPVNHPATFVRKSAYERVGLFDIDLKVAMDYDLMLRLYKSGSKFMYMNDVLASMRYGGESDERFISGLREVYKVSVREGCSRLHALLWYYVKIMMGTCKLLLRRTGLSSLLRLHPRFYSIDSNKDGSR